MIMMMILMVRIIKNTLEEHQRNTEEESRWQQLQNGEQTKACRLIGEPIILSFVSLWSRGRRSSHLSSECVMQ